ncbi:MAG TPA: AMP-binding protein, partial [Propionibacteriaceae bacterium]
MTETPEMAAVAERLAARPPSVGAMLVDQVEKSGPREAFRYREGDRWVSLTWNETRDRAFNLAAGLLALGIQPEDRVAIACSTRIEWILADLAVMCAGGATTTVYPTTQHEDVAYIVGDSESRVIFAEDELQVAKVLDHLDSLPLLGKIVLMSGHVDHERVLDLVQFEALGREYLAANPDCVDEAIAKTGPDSLSTLIYTSGTTGRPKGVRLAHDAWTYTGAAISELELLNRDDLQYLWLPLSHVFGKVLNAVQLRIGFATAVDGNIDRIVENLGQVHPTFMAGAPRIFEKVRAKVMV